MKIVNKIGACLPYRLQAKMKRYYYKIQIKRDAFLSPEPEVNILNRVISKGDFVLDIGANIGHYTKCFSDIVGIEGRVIAFEPVPETFSLLTSNVQEMLYGNVTLINAAVSDKTEFVNIMVPKYDTGTKNYYQAHIQSNTIETCDACVMAISIDALNLNRVVKLAKIDVEGHEMPVLRGMENLITKYGPTLIIETDSIDVKQYLASHGYKHTILTNSPNIIFSKNMELQSQII
jgi:FkbM family methyltransferase